MFGACFSCEIAQKSQLRKTYVNPVMQEKPRFELEQVVEVFVEVVETLQTQGFTETGMKDAGSVGGIFAVFMPSGTSKIIIVPGDQAVSRLLEENLALPAGTPLTNGL